MNEDTSMRIRHYTCVPELNRRASSTPLPVTSGFIFICAFGATGLKGANLLTDRIEVGAFFLVFGETNAWWTITSILTTFFVTMVMGAVRLRAAGGQDESSTSYQRRRNAAAVLLGIFATIVLLCVTYTLVCAPSSI